MFRPMSPAELRIDFGPSSKFVVQPYHRENEGYQQEIKSVIQSFGNYVTTFS